MCVCFKVGELLWLFSFIPYLYIVFFFKEGQEWLGWNTSQALIVVFISSHSCLLFYSNMKTVVIPSALSANHGSLSEASLPG